MTTSLPPVDALEVTLSKTTGHACYKEDLFAFKASKQTPWIPENTMSFNPPAEYQGRIRNGSLVNYGGNTVMGLTTHHTWERPKLPPGTIQGKTFTITQYLPDADPAIEETRQVAHAVRPHLEALVEACKQYHRFTPEGWITTAGFMTAARNAGLELSRGEFLALERSVRKDTMGRFSFLELEQLVLRLTAES